MSKSDDKERKNPPHEDKKEKEEKTPSLKFPRSPKANKHWREW